MSGNKVFERNFEMSSNNIIEGCALERAADPAECFAQYADELAAVNADAFGPSAGAELSEHFESASIAHVMRYGRHIVGFGLYSVLRGHHWRQPAIG
jgi:hypothetical protein